MKQKDLILIMVVIFVGVVLSIFASKLFISPSKKKAQTVEVVTPINGDFPQADSKYFNSNSIDPSRNITIGGGANPQPFSNKQ